jgi:hypothetical protein
MMFPEQSLTPDERRLLDRAACWPGAAALELSNALGRLAAAEGLDFATALLYDRLRRSPVHGPFIDRLEAMTEPPGRCSADPSVSVVIVPGAFHRERPDSGADGRFVREEAARTGYPASVIPLPSFGPPAECGRLICNALLRHDGPPIVLVSLSKGGTDVRAALARPEADEAFARVTAWVSLSGIVRGTPLVDWLRRRRLRMLFIRMMFWLRGYPFAVLRELDREPDDAPALRLPAHLLVIHVTGFPLQRHLTNRLLRRGHRRLAPLGPNDGVALLSDVCRLPGVVYPIWGADHYLRLAGRDVRGLFARILCLVMAGKEHHEDPAPLAGR